MHADINAYTLIKKRGFKRITSPVIYPLKYITSIFIHISILNNYPAVKGSLYHRN